MNRDVDSRKAGPSTINNGHKWREERVQRLNLNARENSEARESLDGDPIERGCV